MPIPSQGQFEELLGYSLKKDYLGDSFNWRNIENFSFTVVLTDFGNLSEDSHGDNYLSATIKNVLKAKYGVDRNNITIKSINIDMSHGDADHLRIARYKVTAEVRSKIDEKTLYTQHPELVEETTTVDGTTFTGDAESHKFHGVKDVFLNYAEEVDSLSESFDFSEGEDGKKDFSHSINLTVRSNATQSSKTVAQNIANTLFSQDANNTYFGHNAFSGALENYGNSSNNKHYFSESYDQWKNQFSFTKKMSVLPEGASTYTASKKYSLDIKADGGISVGETLELKSRNGSWSDLKSAAQDFLDGSYNRCSSILASYSNTIDGQGSNTSTTNTLASTLATKPITESIVYNEQGLTISISTTFTDDVQVLGNAQFLETVDLNRDHKGVVQTTYNVTLTSHRQKELNGDALFYVDGLCSVAGECDGGGWTTKATCEGEGECFDSDDDPVSGADNDKNLCESVTGNYFVSAGNSWTAYDTETKCEDDGGASWTQGKTALDVLKEYGDNAVTKICTIANYSGTGSGTVKTDFSNVLSWWWPTGGDRPFPFFGTTVNKRSFIRQTGCNFYPVTSSVSSPNLGKTFTLNMTLSNDAKYDMDTVSQTDYRTICADCFKKIEVKWQDTWPKKSISEHTVIGRGGLGDDNWIPYSTDQFGNVIYINSPTTSAVTSNKPGTSVIADHYMTLAGKRSVTINAVLKRKKRTNNLSTPYFPTDELEALAAEAKNALVQVFFHERVKNSYQSVAYISNINYTFNSENQVTMTAELTYTYKAPPPGWASGPVIN